MACQHTAVQICSGLILSYCSEMKSCIKYHLHFLFGFLLIGDLFAQTGPAHTGDKLRDNFLNPPIQARPRALWPWTNGNLSLSQIRFEMEEAKRKGMGGFDIWDLGVLVDPENEIPAGPAFLSDESVDAIAFALREGDRLGLELGLTISSSWNAGGSWVKPEHGAMGIYSTDTILTGPVQLNAKMAVPRAPEKYGNRINLLYYDSATGLPQFYRDIATLAHPMSPDSSIATIDQITILAGSTDSAGFVRWQVPEGRWRIVRYVCLPTGQPLAIPSPNSQGLMLDHFSAEAQQQNLEYIFSRLIPKTGSLKNRSLKYFYADSYEVNTAVWTPLLPEEFFKRRGYDLKKYLPVLDGFRLLTDPDSRFMFDFKKTLSDLIIDNHYKLGKEICNKYGIGFVAEAGGPGQPIHNVPFEDLKALGALSVPRGEFWNRHPQLELLQIVKGIASASHLYNQKFVEAESFTSVWLWQEGPDELKPLADRAMAEGLNRFVYHSFPHTVPESGYPGWVYNFGTLINTTNGWWPKSEGFHHYLARSSYLLQEGNFVGDIAYYYGDRAPNFVKPKNKNSVAGFGYDYDVVNTEIILNRMKVKAGRIYLPHGQYYHVLVLPEDPEMNLDLARKLVTLVEQGATVIGKAPLRSNGLKDSSQNNLLLREIVTKLWGTDSTKAEKRTGKGKMVWGKSIRQDLTEMLVLPDLDLLPASAMDSVDFIHRRSMNAEIYFIRNQSDVPVTGFFRFRFTGRQPEIWYPDSGEISMIHAFKTDKYYTEIPITLKSNGSLFVIFRKPLSKKSNSVAMDPSSTLEMGPDLMHLKNRLWTSTSGLYRGLENGRAFEKQIEVPGKFTLRGPWELRFSQNGTNPPITEMETLIPLNESPDERLRYFSGSVSYHHHFEWPAQEPDTNLQAYLRLNKLREIAEIFLNGHRIGISWFSPNEINISQFVRPGKNHLIVEVVNTPNNALIGDAKLSEKPRFKSNIKRLPNAWMKPFAEADLLDAGLIGPVEIYFSVPIGP